LFCLLTLACVLLALLLSDALTDEERWLVGPACGSALVGILLARLCSRGAWLAGLVLGTLGAAVVVGREAIPRYGIYQHLLQRAPSRLPDFWTNLTIMTFSGIVAGFALALLSCACFHFPLWATRRGESGMLASVRRRPRPAAGIGVVVALLLLGLWQIDAIIWPRGWVPRHTVFLPRLPQDESNPSMPGSRLALSRRGDWIAIYLSGIRPGQKGRFKGTLLYRLGDRPEAFELPGIAAEQIEAPAFSFTDENGFAFLSYQMATDKPHDQVNIAALASRTILRTVVDPRRSLGTLDGDRLDWLPDGAIVHSAWSGGGAVVYDAATGEERSKIADDAIYYDARLGHRYHVMADESARPVTKAISVVDLVTQQELSRHANVLISNAYCVKASRDGKSILTRGGSYLGQPPANASQRELWTYGPGNQLVISGDFDDYPWLMQIPFGKRVAAWLNRDALRIVDLETGEELARTRPVASAIDAVALSHDGSRLAVLNLEGVSIYDVPAAFR
jgi:hypothetical protein